MATDQVWFGLVIGNSRFHWAKFKGDLLLKYWDTNYLGPKNYQEDKTIPILLASVVPQQTILWQKLPQVKVISLADLPLNNLYPTLGIDRALAVLGLGVTYGWPALMIDAGTALTLTGVDEDKNLVGGAILPGLKLQFATLSQRTAALPDVNIPLHLPRRWAMNTTEAIESGITYTILAGIRDFIEAWLKDFRDSTIAITGGDRQILLSDLKSEYPNLATQIKLMPEAIFQGLLEVYFNQDINFKKRG